MAIDKTTLEHMLTNAFPDATITLDSLIDDGDHYTVHVESADFSGKNRVQQHKMVYEALGGKMGGELHALQVKTSVKQG